MLILFQNSKSYLIVLSNDVSFMSEIFLEGANYNKNILLRTCCTVIYVHQCIYVSKIHMDKYLLSLSNTRAEKSAMLFNMHNKHEITISFFIQCTEVQNATFQSRKFYQLELHRKPVLKLGNNSFYS